MTKPIGILIGVFIIAALSCYAQTAGRVSGVILDAMTKKPVPYVTLFLANTLFGSRSDDNGAYSLKNIPQGKYNLTISSVGYKLATVPIVITDQEKKLTILLHTDTKILKEVTVTSRNSDYFRNLRKFKKYFLGETFNASRCKIMNIEDITISYDFDTRKLSASCEKPIVIENRSLGYTVEYLLLLFEVDDRTGIFRISGIPRFIQLPTEKKSNLRHWQKQRNRAYYGSLTHFMRSLKYSCLEEDGFHLYLMLPQFSKPKYFTETEKVNDTTYAPVRIRESDLFKRPFDEHTFLKIIYTGENQENAFPGTSGVRGVSLPQTSWLKFLRHALVIYHNGYFEDELSYATLGYFGWSNGVAEMIPLEYQPGSKYSKDSGVNESPEDSIVHKSISGLGSLTGVITDASTSLPIPGAAIFFANTEISGTVSALGEFSIKNINPGRYDLIIAAPWYEYRVLPFLVRSTDEKISVTLTKSSSREQMIKAVSDPQTDIVKEYLLGITNNSRKCIIKNFRDLQIQYDSIRQILSATASNPIIIENLALGYVVTCWLKYFSFNYIDHSYGTTAHCALSDMAPSHANQWRAARNVVWEGSFLQFLESMRARTLKKDHYEIFRQEGQNWVPTDEAWMFSDRLDLPVELKVVYTNEYPESNYASQNAYGQPQVSWVVLSKESLRSWPNIYLRPLGYYSLRGYFAYINGIAELIPLDYRPPAK